MRHRALCLILVLTGMGPPSFGSLLNVSLTFPKISYVNQSSSALDYTAADQMFSVNATPTTLLFASGQTPQLITGGSLEIQIVVDNTGALVGGVAGNDFSLSGTVTQGGNTYSGLLLAGEVMGFGFLESGASDLYDFRFTSITGALADFFPGTIGVQLVSEVSTFNNDFTADFNGSAKGTVGSEVPDNTSTIGLLGVVCCGLLFFHRRLKTV